MDVNSYLLILVGMGLATYLPRWLPLQLLSSRRLPEIAETWLDLIPAAILSALLVPALLIGGDPPKFDLLRPELWVAFPTFLFAALTRSLGGTVILGMLLFWMTKTLL